MDILIVPDKFKGTLTAGQAAEAIARGWSDARPEDRLHLFPMADGGDGFGEIVGGLLGAERRMCRTIDAAGRICDARWWYEPASATAIVEAAQVNGLALLPDGVYHPFQLDTTGLAAVLRQASEAGARRLFVGIGGSATNDGGFGLSRALGWKFRDAADNEILTWIDLERLARVEQPSAFLQFDELIIAVDVINPLLGDDGATRIYGPQKGLRETDIARAESCLARFAEVLRVHLAEDFALIPGAGAAGGLGFGLKAFCNGTFRSGGEIFMELFKIEERIQTCDLVITAEGALDTQSLMGKGVGLIAAAAGRVGKQCVCLAGSVAFDAAKAPWPGFHALAIVPHIAALPRAMAYPGECLRQLARCAAREFSPQ